ncbi:adaptin ear-binding coat-associated protein 1 NECAP-1, partial [Martensiomyces pterosporus]
MSEFESVLFLCKEVYVYQIPPRQANAGYRATEWSVDSPIFRARLRVLLTGESKCAIRLEDKSTGELFAACPYDAKGLAVEQVLDSSRYFVLRVQDEATGSKMYVGIGFLDRSEAFDFNVALDDYRRSVRDEAASPLSSAGSWSRSKSSADGADTAPVEDFTLKPDQKITVNISGFRKKAPASSGSAANAAAAGQLSDSPFFIPPPP